MCREETYMLCEKGLGCAGQPHYSVVQMTADAPRAECQTAPCACNVKRVAVDESVSGERAKAEGGGANGFFVRCPAMQPNLPCHEAEQATLGLNVPPLGF